MEFIKNSKILEEDYRVADLLDFSIPVEDFKKILNNLKTNCVLGLVGRFGSGKSTMIYQLQNSLVDNQKWIQFDAWKYPERKDLWEGFVLDFAKQVNDKLFKNIKDKIEGTNTGAIKQLIGIIAKGADFFYPGTGIVAKFTYFFNTSPVKRVFEIQELLKKIIFEVDKDIFIVIEDIDRSNDKGIFFIETLRNFLKENNFSKKIIVIIPIGDKQYLDQEDSYLKTLDYRFDFKPKGISFKGLIQASFSDDYIRSSTNIVEQLDYLFELLIRERNLTIRDIKHILRLTNLIFKKSANQDKYDARVLILFVCCKYLKDNITENIDGQYDVVKKIKDSFWGKKYLIMIASDLRESDLRQRSININVPIFLSDNNYIIPKFIRDTFDSSSSGYYLSKLYVDIE